LISNYTNTKDLRSIRVFFALLNPNGYKNVDCLYPFHTKYKYIYARIEIK
jgi:hypothetical protein